MKLFLYFLLYTNNTLYKTIRFRMRRIGAIYVTSALRLALKAVTSLVVQHLQHQPTSDEVPYELKQ